MQIVSPEAIPTPEQQAYGTTADLARSAVLALPKAMVAKHALGYAGQFAFRRPFGGVDQGISYKGAPAFTGISTLLGTSKGLMRAVGGTAGGAALLSAMGMDRGDAAITSAAINLGPRLLGFGSKVLGGIANLPLINKLGLQDTVTFGIQSTKKTGIAGFMEAAGFKPPAALERISSGTTVVGSRIGGTSFTPTLEGFKPSKAYDVMYKSVNKQHWMGAYSNETRDRKYRALEKMLDKEKNQYLLSQVEKHKLTTGLESAKGFKGLSDAQFSDIKGAFKIGDNYTATAFSQGVNRTTANQIYIDKLQDEMAAAGRPRVPDAVFGTKADDRISEKITSRMMEDSVKTVTQQTAVDRKTLEKVLRTSVFEDVGAQEMMAKVGGRTNQALSTLYGRAMTKADVQKVLSGDLNKIIDRVGLSFSKLGPEAGLEVAGHISGAVEEAAGATRIERVKQLIGKGKGARATRAYYEGLAANEAIGIDQLEDVMNVARGTYTKGGKPLARSAIQQQMGQKGVNRLMRRSWTKVGMRAAGIAGGALGVATVGVLAAQGLHAGAKKMNQAITEINTSLRQTEMGGRGAFSNAEVSTERQRALAAMQFVRSGRDFIGQEARLIAEGS